MGAANLMSSKLVGSDQNGNLIGAVVRSGLPNLQTAMPQYSDYTNQQIQDLAAYVHYLRQQGRYKELTSLNESAPGDAKKGRDYFYGAAHCDSCHAPEGDLAKVATKYVPAVLRARLLRPGTADPDSAPGPNAHRRLLENYSNDDVRNLLAYLATMK